MCDGGRTTNEDHDPMRWQHTVFLYEQYYLLTRVLGYNRIGSSKIHLMKLQHPNQIVLNCFQLSGTPTRMSLTCYPCTVHGVSYDNLELSFVCNENSIILNMLET